MDFPDAMREVIDDKRVTKLEWANPEIYVCLANGRLKIKTKDKILSDFIVSDGDMLGTDWVAVGMN